MHIKLILGLFNIYMVYFYGCHSLQSVRVCVRAFFFLLFLLFNQLTILPCSNKITHAHLYTFLARFPYGMWSFWVGVFGFDSLSYVVCLKWLRAFDTPQQRKQWVKVSIVESSRRCVVFRFSRFCRKKTNNLYVYVFLCVILLSSKFVRELFWYHWAFVVVCFFFFVSSLLCLSPFRSMNCITLCNIT